MTAKQVGKDESKRGKAIKSTDPRKTSVTQALKQASKGTKVTNVREVAPGVYQGDCLVKARGERRFLDLGTWEVAEV